MAGVDRVRVPVDRRVAEIAKSSTPTITEAAQMRGFCVSSVSAARRAGWNWLGAIGCSVAALLCAICFGTGGVSAEDRRYTAPDGDSNWVPNRPDGLQQDIESVYLELTAHAPAGSVPHVWK